MRTTAAGGRPAHVPAHDESQSELLTVVFSGEADYRRGTDLAFARRDGSGIELTDVPQALSARLRRWLVPEVRDRCNLHLLSGAHRFHDAAGQPGATGTGQGTSTFAAAADAARLLPARRIQILCPCGTAARFRAANETLVLLLKDEQVRHWGGLTYSSIAEPAYTGAFWDVQAGGWVFDRHVLITIDAPETAAEGCDAYAARLHDRVADIYDHHGQPQQRLWVTTQPLTVVHALPGSAPLPREAAQHPRATDHASSRSIPGSATAGDA